MPKVNNKPLKLRPYLFHGLDLTWSEGDKDAVCECPFCEKPDKFGIKIETGQYSCYRCKESGNINTFLQTLWDWSDKDTKEYKELSKNRKLLEPDTLMHWGVVQSFLTNGWMIPGYNISNKTIGQLYRYATVGGKQRLLATSGLGHKIFGLNLFDSNKDNVYICEGPWDAMILWELLGQTKMTDRGLVPTGNPDVSLLSNSNVIAVPGCNVFDPKWCSLFEACTVCIMFDNDHPKVHSKTGKQIEPAGLSGTKRLASILSSSDTPPDSINYVQWGESGMPYELDMPDGYDLRDYLTFLPISHTTALAARLDSLNHLMRKLVPVPAKWLNGSSRASNSGVDGKPPSGTIECIPCNEYKKLSLSWKKAMKWTAGLDHALSSMLASIASTCTVGDQLWLKVIGPAACLHGDTPIYDPIAEKTKTVKERTEECLPFHVWSIQKDNTIKASKAFPPHRSFHLEEMFVIEFHSGRKLKVTGNHRILTGTEYDRVCYIQDFFHIHKNFHLPLFSKIESDNNPYYEEDTIKSIDSLGQHFFYDFHVPGTNNYWAEGFFHHNCGKSTLCEALSVNKKHILAKSTLRGFHSGYIKEGSTKDQDNSLLSELRNKTLITKDGDTLLQSPNLPQILSEARDIYDGASRTSYRNAMSKNYEGVRMTWLLCGTSSLRSIDSSELGERFLDCVIMETIDDELEDEILSRVAYRASKNVSLETDGKVQTHYDPALVQAMSLTGGYIDFLKEDTAAKLELVDMPTRSLEKCIRLGKFVAFLRARPSIHQDENAERELASRLVSQHIRLAKCLSLVLNHNTVNEVVMKRIRRIALDTSRGVTLDITNQLYVEELEARALAIRLGKVQTLISKLLRFLSQIGVVENFREEKVEGLRTTPKWRLTEKMNKLYSDVMEDL